MITEMAQLRIAANVADVTGQPVPVSGEVLLDLLDDIEGLAVVQAQDARTVRIQCENVLRVGIRDWLQGRKVVCAHCGTLTPGDHHDHWKVCPEHPARAVVAGQEADMDILRSENVELKRRWYEAFHAAEEAQANAESWSAAFGKLQARLVDAGNGEALKEAEARIELYRTNAFEQSEIIRAQQGDNSRLAATVNVRDATIKRLLIRLSDAESNLEETEGDAKKLGAVLAASRLETANLSRLVNERDATLARVASALHGASDCDVVGLAQRHMLNHQARERQVTMLQGRVVELEDALEGKAGKSGLLPV